MLLSGCINDKNIRSQSNYTLIVKISKNAKDLIILVKSILRILCSLGLPFILNWSRSRILIFDEFMGQLLSNLVRMPKYGHNSAIFS